MFKPTLIARLLLLLLSYLFIAKLISIFALSSFDKVEIQMTSTTKDSVQIYYTGGKRHLAFTENHSAKTKYEIGESKAPVTFRLKNATVNTLRIDPGSSPGSFSISRIVMHSFFGPPITITPERKSLTTTVDPESTLKTTSAGWDISSTGVDPYIVFTGDIQTQNPFLQYFLPAIFSFVILIFTGRYNFLGGDCKITSLPFLNDITSKNPSSGNNYSALDGVRGLAALLVLGDHSGFPGLEGAGSVGVVIFFCLSGFLLTMPFAHSPDKISNSKYVKHYFMRRLKRIVPMFYFISIIGYLFKSEFGDFFRTILFLQGNNILWTVLQEIYFYGLLPFLIAINHFLFRGNMRICVAFLLTLSLAFNYNLIPVFQVYGNGNLQPLYMGIFLSGMTMCYALHIASFRNNGIIKAIVNNPLTSLICIALLCVPQYLYLLIPTVHSNPISFYGNYYCLIVSAVLLSITLSNRSIVSRFFSFYPLRAIGIVGYSFYLLHPLVLTITKDFTELYFGFQLHGIPRFGVVLVITYFLSTITYTYIERPFLKKD